MADKDFPTVTPDALRLGLFVHLDLGWLDHPFPLSRFKITSQDQIDTIRGLGLSAIRYDPSKSDLPARAEPVVAPPRAANDETVMASPEQAAREARRQLLQAQRQSLQVCERQFSEAARQVKIVFDEVVAQPKPSLERSLAVVNGFIDQMHSHGETVIRLLSEGMGDRSALHSVNVTILSLLLGKALGMDATQIKDLGTAALLHDIGKTNIPDRLRFRDDQFSLPETRLYQEHVAHGTTLAKAMGMSPGATLGLLLHHEMEDASGFPQGLGKDKLTPVSRVLALVNRYDNLCNPVSVNTALTPHEALSLIFSQMKERHDVTVLGAFIRMMGVYPPGSVVQFFPRRHEGRPTPQRPVDT